MRYNRVVGQSHLPYIIFAYEIGQPKMMGASHDDGNSLLRLSARGFPIAVALPPHTVLPPEQ